MQLPRLVDECVVAKEVARVAERNRRLLGRCPATTLRDGQRLTAQQPAAAAVLLQWVQAVAAFFGVVIDDFGVSFADGRVMCLLVRWQRARVKSLQHDTSQSMHRTVVAYGSCWH